MSPLDAKDPLSLLPLFKGAESWEPILRPALEAQPEASTFIGPARAPTVVPVRELTFQAFKPNPPARWRVVVFGQNPYPRVESATGIAMFDNSFEDWRDGRFGRVTSIRCIMKAACMWKHGVAKKTSTADLRALLEREDIVAPPGWFQSMLSQGVLLLNASLTASSDKSLSTARHTQFWRPVIEQVVEALLEAKQNSGGGLVFAWWGSHAKALRKVVERLEDRYPGATVRHVDHCNPAAMGDAFCDDDPFGAINQALRQVGEAEIEWLPSRSWSAPDAAVASKMGQFIADTQALHKTYLERLQDVEQQPAAVLDAITGVFSRPPMSFRDSVAPLFASLRIEQFARVSQKAAETLAKSSALEPDEVAALHLYTMNSPLYRQLNASLRDPDRSAVIPYLSYLRLLLGAIRKLAAAPPPPKLYRGVAVDLRSEYQSKEEITWWGVSSLTPSLSIAHSFLGGSGRRTLFEVRCQRAVRISNLSVYQNEEEYLLSPGTRLRVDSTRTEPKGLSVVSLSELEAPPLVH